MWTCPVCGRNFKTRNQSHFCTQRDVGELFADKPDELVIAYDDLVQVVSRWEPNSIGSSVNTVVMSSQKAWLIVRPMKKELDLKFYYDQPIESGKIKKVGTMGKKYAHHIRIQDPEQLDSEVFRLLKMGHEFSLR